MHELMSLSEIMAAEETGRFLRIPDYQRGYSWQTPQRQDLLADIENLSAHDDDASRHFTGTIVAAPGSQNESVLDVIDGQQRLTSLLLLIARALLKLEAAVRDEEQQRKYADLRDKYLVHERGVGDTVYRLELQKDTDFRFKDLVRSIPVDTAHLPSSNKADDNLRTAAQEFDGWLENNARELDAESVIRLATERLGFIFYRPTSNLEAGLMFEVINSRGKPLSELEKVKNFLIYFASLKGMPSLHSYVNEAWSKILRFLNQADLTSNADESGFLRTCWILFDDPSPRPSETVYSALRSKVEGLADNRAQYELLSRFVKLMEHAASTYARMYTSSSEFSREPDIALLEEISCQPRRAAIMPLIVAVFFKAGTPDKLPVRKDLLSLLEKLNFRYYVLRIAPRSDSNHGHLFWLAHRYFHDEPDENGVATDEAYLRRELVQFIAEEAATKRFVKYLVLEPDESWDFYEWNGLKYFLANYEQKLRRERHEGASTKAILQPRNPEARNDFYHQEHIFARHATDSIHQDWAPFLQRRLGNFVLTRESRNISASDRSVGEKIEQAYASNDSTMLYQLTELNAFWDKAYDWAFNEWGWKNHCRGSLTNWIQYFGDLREEALVSFALERWHVPEVDGDAPNVVEIATNYELRSGFGAEWSFVSGPAYEADQQRKKESA